MSKHPLQTAALLLAGSLATIAEAAADPPPPNESAGAQRLIIRSLRDGHRGG